MVNVSIMNFTVLMVMLQPSDSSLPRVLDARLLNDCPKSIKPCEPLSLLVNVKLDSAVTTDKWRGILGRASDIVRMNGREFRNRLGRESGLNDAASFEMFSDSVDAVPSDTAMFVITLFVNAAERVCLFEKPGNYAIGFLVGDLPVTVPVTVAEPTRADQRVIDTINDVSVLLFLRDPTDRGNATSQVIESVGRAALEDTSYKKVLFVALGIAKLNEPMALSGTDPVRDDELRFERLREVRQLLCPNISNTINSKLEAAAAVDCGTVLSMLRVTEPNQAEKNSLAVERDRLWRLAAESPYSGEYAAKAEKLRADTALR